jgi:cell division protein FtsX
VAILATNQARSPTGHVASQGPTEVAADALPSARSDLEVFMKVDASDAEIATVRRGIVSSGTVRRFAYVDQEAALAEFRRIYGRDPDLVRNVTASALPTSFRLVLEPHASPDVIRSLVENQPGVEAVSNPIAKSIRAFDNFHDHANLQIFMSVDATDAQIRAILGLLQRQPEIASITFYDKPAALAAFRRAYRNEPQLVHNVTANALPTSFRIVLRPHASAQQVRSIVQPLPGIDTIQTLRG